ncbi:MAG: hypothetical protein SLRJCFUN_001557 [Candidatus Fervidibacter sp.]
MMRRWTGLLLAVGCALGIFVLWASSQMRGQMPQWRDDDLKARVEALEKRVRELEQRLARLERQHLRPFFFAPPGVIVPPVPFGFPPTERRAPRFGEPRPAPDPFVQPYYYPLTPEE